MRRFKIVALIFSKVVGFQKQIHHSEDPVHRGSNLMTHVGEKFLLRLGCGLRFGRHFRELFVFP